MAATMFSLGAVTVPAGGTPVQLPVATSSVAGPLAAQGFKSAHAIALQALAGNTGKVYIGIKGLNKSTLAGVLMVLPVPTVNLIGAFSISLTAAANALALDDIYIDADNNGEGVLVSGVVA